MSAADGPGASTFGGQRFGRPLPSGVRPPIPPATPWLGDVLPAAIAALGLPTDGGVSEGVGLGDPVSAEAYGLEGASQVVIVLVDGLGTVPLTDRYSYAPTLRTAGSEPTVAQSCSPATTAAAITTFATGAVPAVTRMVGYSVDYENQFMNLLHFRSGVTPEVWQPVPTFFERLASVGCETALVTDPKFRDSGLTRAALRGATFVGAEALDSRFAATLEALRRGVPIVVVYWAELDKVGHRLGPRSPEWAQALESFDSELGRFLKAVPEDVSVVLTADHGMVQVEERIDIAEVSELREGVRVIAGEGRAVHVHAEPGQAGAVVERWSEFLGGRAWLFPRDRMSLVVGEGPGVGLMGDLLVMPDEAYVVVDSRTQPAAAIAMEGVHGSLTEAEMSIPVWRLQ